MFVVTHLLAIMILLFLPAFERARQRARELRKSNQSVESLAWAQRLIARYTSDLASPNEGKTRNGSRQDAFNSAASITTADQGSRRVQHDYTYTLTAWRPL
jgi:hypothetical protein